MNKLPDPDKIAEIYLHSQSDHNDIIAAMKEYGRQVRDITLEWAAENTYLESFGGTNEGTSAIRFSNGEDYLVFINKNTILKGKDSEQLKIE